MISTDAVLNGGVEPHPILVVDDNEANREVLARRLQKQQFAVEMAADGREALEKIRAQAFDLVLLDIMMPDVDGYEVLRQIKADETLRRIPVIMISALGDMDSVVRCIEMGAEDYLPKPFSPTLLKARVTACLEKKRAADRENQLFVQLQSNYARLRQLEQQRDDLTHMIVHDLRSPLSANLAGLEMVEMLGPLSKEQKECLAIAMRSGHNLLGLINDLLDISKMEVGALTLYRSTLDVRHMIAIAADQVMPLLTDKQIALSREFAPELPAVYADESKLQRVLVNLFANAIKFTPREGQIAVGARSEDGHVVFRFRDTGEGIPPESMTTIFDKFNQVETRKAGHQNSTGLGLTFCKMTVEAHGGRIWAESTPGDGSTFFFTIPTAAPSES